MRIHLLSSGREQRDGHFTEKAPKLSVFCAVCVSADQNSGGGGRWGGLVTVCAAI
jgi:hypothetical protein